MVLKLEHPVKMPVEMLVTDLGMTTEVSPVPAKAEASMLLSEFGKVIDLRLLQYTNAPSSTLVIELGRVMEDSAEKEKANWPIEVSPVKY